MTIAHRTRARVTAPNELSAAERDRMYAIMCEHFLNVDRGTFDRDLTEKDWVVRMDDADGLLQGFTTLKLLRHREGNQEYLGFFSGDTVLSTDFASEGAWLGTWSRFVLSVAEQHPECRSYWVLLTATHRTYRILSTAYRVFIPDADRTAAETTHERELLNAFVRQKYPNEFNETTGIVSSNPPVPYRNAAEVEANNGDHNRHNRYFHSLNPGYLKGDFLCCLTELSRENLTALGRRITASDAGAE